MYWLILWSLIFLIVVAIVLATVGLLPVIFPIGLIISSTELILFCAILNNIFASFFDAVTNKESAYITALILALIITPPRDLFDWNFLITTFMLSSIAVASKYILAIGHKHLLNPAAIAATISSLIFSQSASWWVGTTIMIPFVAVTGFLIVRKIQRSDLVISFLITSILFVAGHDVILKNISIGVSLHRIIFETPIIFFATIMLTEPLTMPPQKSRRIIYGALTGFLFAPFINILGIYSTPELALIVGNIFSYAASPKGRFILKLKEKKLIAKDIYDFIFEPDKKITFKPGQYLEWTLSHKSPDCRGNRRYFTIASSPTEENVRIGVKFYIGGSSFKNGLSDMNNGDKIIGAQLSGDFVMPEDVDKKLAFIAGGIGITPFRSMTKYLMDKKEKRDITILYSVKTIEDIAYQDIFDKAKEQLGTKVFYGTDNLDKNKITENIPDYIERIFYLSGPHAMVVSFEKILKELGLKKNQIKTDYFPGFA